MKTLTPQILAMYLNGETLCEYKDEDGNEITAPILAINIQGYAAFVDPEFEEWIPIADVKPFLRPLSSMTEEEAAQVGEIVFGKHDSVKWRSRAERNEKGDIKYYTVYRKYYELFLTIDVPTGEVECYRENKESPGLDDKEIYNNQHKVTAYLLSESFDLFGLIESGLAINKTKTI